jgi:DNA-binding NtrC family response regulator
MADSSRAAQLGMGPVMDMQMRDRQMHRSSRILIVEDDAVLCSLLHTLLSRAGYQVLTAMNGEQGLAMAIQEEVSLVMTDLRLPGVHGLELLESLRAEKPHVAAILMSGSASRAQIARAQDMGAVSFLAKPFASVGDVLDLVAEALDQHPSELVSTGAGGGYHERT